MCLNGRHLFLGTHLENMADRNQKDRQARGERVGTAVLTDRKATQIRSLYAAGGFTQKELAEVYGVSRVAVSCILRGRTYAHLLSPIIAAPVTFILAS
jgi:DNA-binding XRE family transcriptional regulator